jgi:hypothetical protein
MAAGGQRLGQALELIEEADNRIALVTKEWEPSSWKSASYGEAGHLAGTTPSKT